MFGNKIKISQELHDKLKLAASAAGCSSIEEFAEGVLDREAQRVIRPASKDQVSEEEVEAIANKLKGLGYLE